MSDPKQLKFQFVVDEASLQKTRQLIRELTADLAKLNAEAGKAGGISGPGLNVTAGQRQSPEQQKIISKTPAVARPIVQGFMDGRQIFKQLTEGSKDSLRAMDQTVKSSVSKQKQELDALNVTVKNLRKSYQDLSDIRSKAEPGSYAEQRAHKNWGDAKDQLGEARRQRGNAQWNYDVNDPKRASELRHLEEAYGEGSGGPGRWSRFKSFMTADRQVPGLQTLMGKNTAMGQIAGRFGITPGMVGSAGIAAVGAWGMKQIGNQLENSPDFQLRSDANMGAAYSQRSLDIRGGEFRNIAATQAILRDSEKRKDYESLNSGWRRFKSSTGAFFSGDFNEAFSGRAADMAATQRQQAQQQMERDSNPLQDQVLGEFQNYNQTLATGRAFHIGAPKGGGSMLQQIYKIRQSFPGFSDGEIAGSLGTLSSQGTRGGAWPMVGAALHGEAAGIHGLAGSMGTMSRFGGGLNFGNTLRTMAGGNMDATTAGIAGQFIASQQAQLGISTGAGPNSFQGAGLLDMISSGAQGQGGRLVMDQNIRGADYLQRSATGQTSPYQAARNVMMAMEASPGMNPYGTSYMARKMSLTELADSSRGEGGDVNAVFKALGGSKEAAGKYFKAHTQSLLEGVSGEGLADTNAGKMARAMASSGMDPREFFAKQGKKGWKGILGKGATEQDALAAYAGALQASDENLDAGTAMGLARDITGSGGKIKRGGAAGAGGAGSSEMELAKEHLKALTTQVQGAASAMNELTASAKNLAIRAKLEAEGLDMKTGDPAKRARWEQVLQMNPKDVGEARQMEEELNMVSRVRGMTVKKAMPIVSRPGQTFDQFLSHYHLSVNKKGVIE